jgi:hypothetical protein
MAVTKQRRAGARDETQALTARAGFRQPTPLQRAVVPQLLARRDVVAEAGEGTGRTIASLVPLVAPSRVRGGHPGSLILAPGAEDVRKIHRQLKTLTRSSGKPEAVAVGVDDGVRKEARLLSLKPEVVIGTPRRVIDHVRQGNIALGEVRYLAIEAPTQDPGFHRDVEFILSKCSAQCQTAVFVPSLERYEPPRARSRHPVVLRTQDWQATGSAAIDGPHTTRSDRGRGGGPQQGPGTRQPRRGEVAHAGGVEASPDDAALLRAIRAQLEQAENDPDPTHLAQVARLVRRGVPLGRRSLFAAHLLRAAGLHDAPPAAPGQLVRLFINAGRNRRVFPNDILDLFTTRLRIKRQDLGEVKVLDNYSFVEIQSAHAGRAVSELRGVELKGRKLAVDYARPRTEKKPGA